MFIKYQGQNSCSNEINNNVCYILQGQALFMCTYVSIYLFVSLYLELPSLHSFLNSLGAEKTDNAHVQASIYLLPQQPLVLSIGLR